MGTVVNAGEVLEVKVRIYLCRGDVGVAEEFLHAAKLSTGFKQMRCEGMPEEVRVHRHSQSAPPRPCGDAQLHGARSQAPAVSGDEYGRFGWFHQGRALARPIPPACTVSGSGQKISPINDMLLSSYRR